MILGSQDSFEVLCDISKDEAWTVIQRRKTNGTLSFHNKFITYKHGFGDLNDEFWLGLHTIALISNKTRLKAKFELKKVIGGWATLTADISIDSTTSDYILTIGKYLNSVHVPLSMNIIQNVVLFRILPKTLV